MLRALKVKTLELRVKLEMGNIEAETFVFGTIEGELIRPAMSARHGGERGAL